MTEAQRAALRKHSKALALYCTILEYAKDYCLRAGCYKLGRLAHMGKNTANLWLHWLENEGFIQVDWGKKGVRSLIHLPKNRPILGMVDVLANSTTYHQSVLNEGLLLTITDLNKSSSNYESREPDSSLPELLLLFLRHGPEEFWDRVPSLTPKDAEACEILLRRYGEEFWTRVFSGIKHDPWLMGKAINAEKGYSSTYTFHFRTLLGKPEAANRKGRDMIIRRALRALENQCSRPALSPAAAQVGMSEDMGPDPRQMELALTPFQTPSRHNISYPKASPSVEQGDSPPESGKEPPKPPCPNPYHEEFERRHQEIQRKYARKVPVEKDSGTGRLRGSISDPWLFAPESEERAA